ncbi:hypothetical protein FTO70_06565 [Methanosarcina sp. KYL-1]|uniref:hypothetical protein n=1 Tax=Methanosarcina sp. KYL-1 TaxID=2602068 RepID=UPI0021011D93|nr:hypothetical protein [Methanosarcina sp. KYL-1]MCQ1535358.1 hypothetical protein [Methanosarcina sp. KYL-1]
MTTLSFEDFMIKAYSNSIYKILKATIESKEVKGAYLEKESQDRDDIDSLLKVESNEVAKDFVEVLKSKGFPQKEISEGEQKKLLKEIIDEHVNKK